MRTHAKPIIALASGAILITGLLGQSVQAQEILNNTALLTSSGGSSDVSVAYTVTETANASSPTGDTFEYTYNVSNPTSGILEFFSLGFDVVKGTIASPGATVVTLPSTTVSGGLAQTVTAGIAGTVLWAVDVAKNGSTGTLEFESDYGPQWVNANANGTSPGPWASSNSGQQVPAPSVVPEPATTGLLAFGILLLPVGNIFRKSLKSFGS